MEVLFVPKTETSTVYVTNMFGGTIWAGTWDEGTKDFTFREAYDFNTSGSAVPLEMYFNEKGDRLYVTTASPGRFHIFDISTGITRPKLLKTIEVGNGAHHVAFYPDEKLAFVQNNLLGLPLDLDLFGQLSCLLGDGASLCFHDESAVFSSRAGFRGAFFRFPHLDLGAFLLTLHSGFDPFEISQPLPEERDEPDLVDLPRLVFRFDRRSLGRLRQLIDHINRV